MAQRHESVNRSLAVDVDGGEVDVSADCLNPACAEFIGCRYLVFAVAGQMGFRIFSACPNQLGAKYRVGVGRNLGGRSWGDECVAADKRAALILGGENQLAAKHPGHDVGQLDLVFWWALCGATLRPLFGYA